MLDKKKGGEAHLNYKINVFQIINILGISGIMFLTRIQQPFNKNVWD